MVREKEAFCALYPCSYTTVKDSVPKDQLTKGKYLYTMFGVGYAICRHWGMMADLFGYEGGLASLVLPAAEEELSQEWIERFLLATQFVIP